jgi:hypothetical protein
MLPAWVGVWTLSAVLSANTGVPRLYSRGTRHIQSAGSTLTIIDDLVRIRGGIVHLEWTGTPDGRDFPVQGVEVFLTSAYREVDDHTLDLTQKVDGRAVVRAKLVLSPDGKTITTTTTDGVTTATTVYAKSRP